MRRTTHLIPRVILRGGGLCVLVALAAGCGGGCSPGGGSGGTTLIIESTPVDGAMVIIGGRDYGETPVTIRGLPAGQYYAILSLYGYKRNTQSIALPEEGEVRVTATMLPIVGYLGLESYPPGAEVYLDGVKHIGTTPLVDVQIPVGVYTYELRLENYLTLRKPIQIQEDNRYTRTHLLRPMRGLLQVFSRPSSSAIYLNDQIQESVTPARFQLTPGVYTVGIYQQGYVLREQAIEILPNGKIAVDIRLEKGQVPPGMLLVPAGEFIFGVSGGAPDEGPRRKIHLDAYYIDKFEVTNEQFAKVFPSHTFDKRLADYPVGGVTWTRASQYAFAVSKRLPTETEWEKAARGVDGLEYPWGNKFDPKLCNLKKDLDSKPAKIGRFRAGASPYGVMDMAGNLYEWTAEWYQKYEGNTEIKTEYGQVFRVLRGGSYESEPFDVRCARRHYDRTEAAREDYGFRCVKDVPDQPDR